MDPPSVAAAKQTVERAGKQLVCGCEQHVVVLCSSEVELSQANLLLLLLPALLRADGRPLTIQPCAVGLRPTPSLLYGLLACSVSAAAAAAAALE